MWSNGWGVGVLSWCAGEGVAECSGRGRPGTLSGGSLLNNAAADHSGNSGT